MSVPRLVAVFLAATLGWLTAAQLCAYGAGTPTTPRSSKAKNAPNPDHSNKPPTQLPHPPPPQALEATGTLLALIGTDGQQATYLPEAGWSVGPFPLSFSAGAIAVSSGTAFVVLRRPGPIEAECHELFCSTWTKTTGFSAPRKVGTVGFTLEGPAAASLGSGALVTFLGTDFKHYYAQMDASAGHHLFEAIPGEMRQHQAFGPSAAVLAGAGSEGVYAAYSGNNAQLFYLQKTGPATAWSPSQPVPGSPIDPRLRPFALVENTGALRLFYVRRSDQRICTVKRDPAANTWTLEETVGDGTASVTPTVAPMAKGDWVVVYRGAQNQGIYFVRGKPGAWGPVGTIEIPSTSTSAPQVFTGLAGADAEVLFVTDGVLKHARISGKSVSVTPVPGTANATHFAAAIVP